jgi:hypothetical protein
MLADQIAIQYESSRVINKTEAGAFLNIDERYGIPNYALLDALKEVFGDNPFDEKSKSNQFLYGAIVDGVRVPNGAWDMVSARFVEATTGPVVTLVGGAAPDRVFAQTEVPALLRNNKITTVDGIPRALLAQLTPDQAFDAIRAISEVRIAGLRIEVDAAGKPLMPDGRLRLDADAFLRDVPPASPKGLDDAVPTRSLADFIPQERLPSHVDGLDELRRLQTDLPDVPGHPGKTGAVLQGLQLLDHLGNAVDVLSLAIAAYEAKIAFDAGDSWKAQSILTDWFLEYGSALAAGRLAAMLTAPLLAAGPLGVLIAAGFTLGASVAGGMYGDDLARGLGDILRRWTDQLIGEVAYHFNLAEVVSSPIILDLNGDGIPTLSRDKAGVHFDHDGNGFAELTGWVSASDGLLVRDLDDNGRIDSGAELFGNATLMPDGSRAFNGFEALRSLDDNQDFRLDAHDAIWNELRIWQDGNSNGRVDDGELLGLEGTGVAALNLNYVYGFRTDPQGNSHRQLGHYVATDGSLAEMVDVWFAVDLARTVHLQPVPVTSEILELPDLPGFGRVGSLHQEMMADTGGILRDLVRQWVAGSSAQRSELIEPLLLHWAGVQDFIDPLATDAVPQRRRLAALEQFMGRDFREGWFDPVPGVRSYAHGDRGFARLAEVIGNQLIAQVDVLPLLRAAGVRTFEAEGSEPLAIGPVRDLLANWQLGAPDVGRLLRIGRVLEALDGPARSLREAIGLLADNEPGILGVQLQAVAAIETILTGTPAPDRIYGSAGADWLEGDSGDDELFAGTGAGLDVLVGGPGSDHLHGGGGPDIYVLARGDGADRITDYDLVSEPFDQIRFVDVASDDLLLVAMVGSSLEIHYGIDDRVTLLNHFADEGHRIEQIHFADGVVWDHSEILRQVAAGTVA